MHDLWQYLLERRKLFLLPLILILVLAGAIAILGTSTAAAPFVYTLF